MNTPDESLTSLDQLLLGLTQTEYGERCFQKFLDLGGSFTENHNTQRAKADLSSNRIELGTQSSSTEVYNITQFSYLPGNSVAGKYGLKKVTISREDMQVIKLLHELGHVIHISLLKGRNDSAIKLTNIVNNQRRKGLFFTRQGNKVFYQNSDKSCGPNEILISTLEDCAELIAMSLHNSVFLNAYLVFLGRSQTGFVQLSPDDQDNLSFLIMDIRDTYLKQ